MAYAMAADVGELAARKLSVEETAMVDRRLEQVERMIIRRIPDLAAQVTAGGIAEVDVVDVEAEAVYRVMRNPEGLSMESDGNYSYQRSREASDNSLRILPGEWSVLGVRVGRMFAIDPNIVMPR
jgi:hypothetical protein